MRRLTSDGSGDPSLEGISPKRSGSIPNPALKTVRYNSNAASAPLAKFSYVLTLTMGGPRCTRVPLECLAELPLQNSSSGMARLLPD